MVLIGDLVPVEAGFALKNLVEGLGGAVECRVDDAKLPAKNRSGYVGSASIEDIEAADEIYLIGCNPRLEAPVLNARIRQAWTKGADVKLVGQAVDLTYDYALIGADRAALANLSKNRKVCEGAVVYHRHGRFDGSRWRGRAWARDGAGRRHWR